MRSARAVDGGAGALDTVGSGVAETAELPVLPADPNPPPGFPRRRLLIAGLVIVVLLVAGTGVGVWHATRSSSTPGVTFTTKTVNVTTGNIKQTVSTTGTIEPATQANLNFGVSGRVTTVSVKPGQTVAVGQALATLDSTALQASVDSASASLSSAQARLSSDQSSGASTSQIDSDQSSVTSAQSQLSSAETSLANATLSSTIAGTVASVNVAVGQEVTGSSGSSASASPANAGNGGTGGSGTGSAGTGSGSTSPGASGASSGASSSGGSTSSSTSSSADVVVVGTGSYIVNATVDDTQIGQIKAGDQAVITPTGSNSTAYGTVGTIGLIATQSSNVATFPVTIDVTGSPAGLYAGSTANVSIIVKQLDNVVEVPTAAVSYSSGNPTVVVVRGGQHVTTPVTLGQSASGETQVTKGLSPGEQVLERVVHFSGLPGGRGQGLLGGAGGFGGSGGLGGGGGFGGAGGPRAGFTPGGGGFGG